MHAGLVTPVWYKYIYIDTISFSLCFILSYECDGCDVHVVWSWFYFSLLSFQYWRLEFRYKYLNFLLRYATLSIHSGVSLIDPDTINLFVVIFSSFFLFSFCNTLTANPCKCRPACASNRHVFVVYFFVIAIYGKRNDVDKVSSFSYSVPSKRKANQVNPILLVGIQWFRLINYHNTDIGCLLNELNYAVSNSTSLNYIYCRSMDHTRQKKKKTRKKNSKKHTKLDTKHTDIYFFVTVVRWFVRSLAALVLFARPLDKSVRINRSPLHEWTKWKTEKWTKSGGFDCSGTHSQQIPSCMDSARSMLGSLSKPFSIKTTASSGKQAKE